MRGPLDILGEMLADANPIAERLESSVRASVMAEGRGHGLIDDSFFTRYYRYYTVPLLDGLDLMKEEKLDDACFWGTVQVCLGLHLRFVDYLVDGDKAIVNNPRIAGSAAAYLYTAQRKLAERSIKWGPEQWVHYQQCFSFEAEVAAGYMHGPMSLWRRVSPLCVLGRTYCFAQLGNQFVDCYEKFLGWCLLVGDYHDWLKDLAANRRTNVTGFMLQSDGAYPDEAHISSVLTHLRHVLAHEHREIVGLIRGMKCCSLWSLVMRALGSVHASSAV